jgi:outer membrane immunogenic protein
MRCRNIFILLGTILISWSPPTAFAGGETGFYLGAGVGRMDINDKVSSGFDYSAYAAAYKILGGCNFGKIPLLDLAIEGSYVFTDELSDDIDGVDVSYEQSSFNLLGLVGLSFGPFGVFGKLGAGAWDSDTKLGSQKESDSGTGPIYGAGVRLTLFSITGRIEFEYFDQSDVDNLYMTSFSVMYMF